MIVADGNEVVAGVAYRLSDVIAVYPITPSTPMGELADQWSDESRANVMGTVPLVIEMHSEAGVAGAVHGALQAGAMTTTFTASQGLLLMIPAMYKIAGELTPTVFHVAARSVAAQALSIFGDHSDVMAARTTGFAMLASGSVQEAGDLALVAHAATLEARIPFVHFFDGFRTSHEINKVAPLGDGTLCSIVRPDLIAAHRERALTPARPVVRGTAQNPDTYFQGRESVNRWYLECPGIVQETMDRVAAITGRQYHLFDYAGHPAAERVIVIMGSGGETADQTALHLAQQGERVGVLRVRLFRPFDAAAFCAALPPGTRSIAVLDRTKEPGSAGEPLYLDVLAALHERWPAQRPMPGVIGGRYGLSSKEFTPAMVCAVFDELGRPQPKDHFTIGITDDVTFTDLTFDPSFTIEAPDTVRALFYGIGSDGTVGANKNSIKIIGEDTPNHAQGYFVYDSKKSGSVTVSHLRFGPEPIRAPYLLPSANFIACHEFALLERQDVLRLAEPGGVFLLNSAYSRDEIWSHLPRRVQETIADRGLRFYVIDGDRIAREAGIGSRVNTVMQTCFFAISGVLPDGEAIPAIKRAIDKSYGKRGQAIVEKNFAAVDATVANLFLVEPPALVTAAAEQSPTVPASAPEFVRTVIAPMLEGRGDDLPVSVLPADGTYPSGTTKWEKRNVASEIPAWDLDICIQCGKCVLVCPHATIRQKIVEPALLTDAPAGFKSAPARFKEFRDLAYSLQVAPEDCTGCALCVEACPVKNKAIPRLKAINMVAQRPIRDAERANWDFFLTLPEADRAGIPIHQVKYSQLLQPLFEFSGACAGCGETPYLKLLSQLFGDRALIANATGCSSIYGGNQPTTPWTVNAAGRGPAWSNSLFEDNAEFGFGMRLALDQRLTSATAIARELAEVIGPEMVDALDAADQHSEAGVTAQRERVTALQQRLGDLLADPAMAPAHPRLRTLLDLADAFNHTSVWIVGGDGWAYDVGSGGLDHVLASGRNVNILVLDTEVYSNTGGQQSKATPRAAVAKFAAAGRALPKKDLGLLAMSYGHVYVARVAMGADDTQTLKAFIEAAAYDGPSLILAYSHCIAHGYDMRFGLQQQAAAVHSGHWPLYRHNPDREKEGLNPFQLDSKRPDLPLEQYIYREGRYSMLTRSHPRAASELLELARADVAERWKIHERLAFNGDPRSAEKEVTHGDDLDVPRA